MEDVASRAAGDGEAPQAVQQTDRDTVPHAALAVGVAEHHETLFSMELGWVWHKFQDVSVRLRMLPMTCWLQRLSKRTCNKCRYQRYGTLTAHSNPLHDRVAHPQSGRTSSQEKPPTREDLYYYIRVHTKENWSSRRRRPATRRQPRNHGQARVDKLEAG